MWIVIMLQVTQNLLVTLIKLSFYLLRFIVNSLI
jgi:hypothetical protein